MIDREFSRRRFVGGASGVVALVVATGLPGFARATTAPSDLASSIVSTCAPAYADGLSTAQLASGASVWAASQGSAATDMSTRILKYRSGVLATTGAPDALQELARALASPQPLEPVLDGVLDSGQPDAIAVAAVNVDPQTQPKPPLNSLKGTQAEAAWLLNAVRNLVSSAVGASGIEVGDLSLQGA